MLLCRGKKTIEIKVKAFHCMGLASKVIRHRVLLYNRRNIIGTFLRRANPNGQARRNLNEGLCRLTDGSMVPTSAMTVLRKAM